MLEFLASPIDPARAHDVSGLLAWHGRLMVLGWGVLAPLAVLVARFGKIWPGQDWPRELDNPTWWRLHWGAQSLAVALAVGAVALILTDQAALDAPRHRLLGYATLAFGLLQIAGGLLRGSKGGPTEPSLRGDHFDMTPRRLIFEALHKSLGYATLILACATILSGLWAANAAVWMFAGLSGFWSVVFVAFVVLQRRGHAVDTYQAIWGTDPALPGNRRKPQGWGTRRPSDAKPLPRRR